jgi:uncharacterized membrane protein
MSLFSKDFKNKLIEKIGEIESVSGVEVVVVVARHSANYIYMNLAGGIGFGLLGLTYLMFTPEEFPDEYVFFGTLIFFAIGFLLFFIPLFIRFFIPKETLKRNAEIYGRALFQKGLIYETFTRQGILLYLSNLENTVVVIEDKNVTKQFPLHELKILKERFNLIFHPFSNKKTAENFLTEMNNLKEISAKFIPITEDDINEIPDDLEILL